MIHLTITGFNAGAPLCGCDKPARKADGDEFYHAMYFRDLGNPAVCPQCREIWEGADDDE